MKTIINLSMVEGLMALGDPTLFSRLVDLFAETGIRQVQNIQQFALEKNGDKLSLEAHSLKSSAMSLGADTLGSLCLGLESKDTPLDLKLDLIQKLPDEFQAALKELRRLRDLR